MSSCARRPRIAFLGVSFFFCAAPPPNQPQTPDMLTLVKRRGRERRKKREEERLNLLMRAGAGSISRMQASESMDRLWSRYLSSTSSSSIAGEGFGKNRFNRFAAARAISQTSRRDDRNDKARDSEPGEADRCCSCRCRVGVVQARVGGDGDDKRKEGSEDDDTRPGIGCHRKRLPATDWLPRAYACFWLQSTVSTEYNGRYRDPAMPNQPMDARDRLPPFSIL